MTEEQAIAETARAWKLFDENRIDLRELRQLMSIIKRDRAATVLIENEQKRNNP